MKQGTGVRVQGSGVRGQGSGEPVHPTEVEIGPPGHKPAEKYCTNCRHFASDGCECRRLPPVIHPGATMMGNSAAYYPMVDPSKPCGEHTADHPTAENA